MRLAHELSLISATFIGNSCPPGPSHTCFRPSRRFKAVYNPQNKNPFHPASFIGYRCSIKVHSVTTDSTTFVRFLCAFKTEHAKSKFVRSAWEAIHLSFLDAVRQQVAAAPPPRHAVRPRSMHAKRCGTCDWSHRRIRPLLPA